MSRGEEVSGGERVGVGREGGEWRGEGGSREASEGEVFNIYIYIAMCTLYKQSVDLLKLIRWALSE